MASEKGKEKESLRTTNEGGGKAGGVCALLGKFIPAFRWLPHYDVKTQLREDVICGLTLGVMLIPQGMAYASLAGLRPVSGLYASMVPVLVYGLFGTSKHMSFGPFALISILVSQGLTGAGFDASACSNISLPTNSAAEAALAAADCAAYEDAATLLSMLTGVVHVLLCGLRLDKLANLLADPVMTGFTTAAAFIIGTSQVSKFVGFKVSRSLTFVGTWFSAEGLLQRLGETSLPTLAVAVLGFALLKALQQLNRKYCQPPRIPIPSQLVAVIVGIVAVLALGLDGHGVNVVGDIPSGLPVPKLPDLGNLQVLVGPAIVVAFISFIINTSLAKIFAARFEYPVHIKSELLATGVANILGGLFLAYPSSGSLSRGAVIAAVGGDRVSLLHNLVTAATIALTLACLTSLFTKLPQAVLADIIIMAILKLVNFGEGRRLFRSKVLTYLLAYLLALSLCIRMTHDSLPTPRFRSPFSTCCAALPLEVLRGHLPVLVRLHHDAAARRAGRHPARHRLLAAQPALRHGAPRLPRAGRAARYEPVG